MRPRFFVPVLIALLSGCSLLEKEYDTGRSTDVVRDGADALTNTDTGEGDRPGGSGTDPNDDGSDDGSTGGTTDTSDSGGGGDDGGSGGTTDTGEPERVDCTPGAAPVTGNIDECVSSELSCGQSIITTTEGGNSVMDAEDYLNWFCTPFPDGDYSGSERTFQVAVPAGQSATFSLESPCDDLDIFALRWELWENNEMCPDSGNSIVECEADDSRDGGSVTVYADSSRTTHYLIIIDGADGEIANFALDITCDASG